MSAVAPSCTTSPFSVVTIRRAWGSDTSSADRQALRIVTTLNGEVVQDGATADMIFSVREIIAHL
ncbi:MAG: fumarylacetoacetate hydrolase family protein, partial [Planctomycetota bacterium]